MGWKHRAASLFRWIALMAMPAVLLLSGCRNSETGAVSAPPTVEVIRVLQRDVPVHSEWTASTDGNINAVIRPQVQGYLISRDYGEGDFVRKGQILFRIDARSFQAALEQARAQLTQQKARWEIAKANLERIKPLAEKNAVSKKDLDDATGTEQAARAAVIAAKAVVDKAELDLEFTRIVSPIDGIAGMAKAQIGNLVDPDSAEELATISALDPIKVCIPMSEQEYLKYMKEGPESTGRISLDLVLADGTVHSRKGRFAFADRQVDVRTGTIKVAALFPNPGNVLRPGQFARVRAQMTVKEGAMLVPQRSVMELQGSFHVAVVDADSRVSIRPVKVADRIDSLWVIEQGLKPHEQVIVEGLQKVKEGSIVTTRPYAFPKGTASNAEPNAEGAPVAKPDPVEPSPKTGKAAG